MSFASLFTDPFGTFGKIKDAFQDPVGSLFNFVSGRDKATPLEVQSAFYKSKSSKNGIKDQSIFYIELPKNEKVSVRTNASLKPETLLANANKLGSNSDTLLARLEFPIYNDATYTREVAVSEEPVAFNERITTFISSKKPTIRVRGVVSNRTLLKTKVPSQKKPPKSGLIDKLKTKLGERASSTAYLYGRKYALQALKKTEIANKVMKVGTVALPVVSYARNFASDLLSDNSFPSLKEDKIEKHNGLTDCQSFFAIYDTYTQQGYLFNIWYLGIKYTDFLITRFETSMTPTKDNSMMVNIEARQIEQVKGGKNGNESKSDIMNSGSGDQNMCPLGATLLTPEKTLTGIRRVIGL